MTNLLRNQEERESAMVEAGRRAYANRKASGPSNVQSGRSFVAVAQKPVVARLLADRVRPQRKYKDVIPMLADVDVYALAEITGIRLVQAAYHKKAFVKTAESLGRDIQSHVKDQAFAESLPKMWSKKMKRLASTQSGHFRRRSIDGDVRGKVKFLESVGNETLADKLRPALGPSWATSDLIDIGRYLIDVFATSTKLIVEEVIRTASRKSHVRLRLTSRAEEWLSDLDARFEILKPRYTPMTSLPRDWSSNEYGVIDGGYLDNSKARVDFVKTRAQTFEESLDLSPVFDTVNLVQRTPWRINRAILETMNTVWENGTGLGNVPPRYIPDALKPLPPKPREFDRLSAAEKTASVPFRKWMRKRAFIHEFNVQAEAEVRNFGPRIALAQELAAHEAFWHPYKLDFRSRLYSISTLLSPQASAFDRGLIEFAEGRRMGDSEDSADWLAIHGANLYGVDKVPFSERIAWVEEHEAEILASADDPLHNKFWTLADGGAKAWPFLAFAMEWRGYRIAGDNFETHLPIALDGSNSGLQHLSAMLRDEHGASLTNVTPGDGVADIYRTVAESLAEEIERRASDEPDEERRTLAQLWRDSGVIDRKMVKQPVMTFVYGSQPRGMQHQIERELHERDDATGVDRSCLNLSPAVGITNEDASRYLVPILRGVIERHAPKAAAAMVWLKDIAKVYSKTGLPLRWTTPLGFPVVQYYNKGTLKRRRVYIDGRMHEVKVRLENPSALDRKRSSAGVAPNFVHSMDSTHLATTVRRAVAEGITSFSMIHDSFGTHATNTRKLAEVLREAFVDLYAVDRLAEFRTDIAAGLILAEREDLVDDLPEPLESGEMDLEAVRSSAYFFS